MAKTLCKDLDRVKSVDIGDTSTFYAFMAVNTRSGDAFRKQKIRESNVKAAIDACDGTLIVKNDAMFNKTIDSIIGYCCKGRWSPSAAGGGEEPERKCLVVNIPFIDTLENNVIRVMAFVRLHRLTSLCVVGSMPELYDNFNHAKREELGLFVKMLLSGINEMSSSSPQRGEDEDEVITPLPPPLKMPMLRRYKTVVSYVPKSDVVSRQKRYVEMIEEEARRMKEEKGVGRVRQNGPIKRLRVR